MKIVAISLVLLLHVGCRQAPAQNEDQNLKKQHALLYKDAERIAPHIQTLVENLSKGELVEIEQEKIYALTVLAKFYQDSFGSFIIQGNDIRF